MHRNTKQNRCTKSFLIFKGWTTFQRISRTAVVPHYYYSTWTIISLFFHSIFSLCSQRQKEKTFIKLFRLRSCFVKRKFSLHNFCCPEHFRQMCRNCVNAKAKFIQMFAHQNKRCFFSCDEKIQFESDRRYRICDKICHVFRWINWLVQLLFFIELRACAT